MLWDLPSPRLLRIYRNKPNTRKKWAWPPRRFVHCRTKTKSSSSTWRWGEATIRDVGSRRSSLTHWAPTRSSTASTAACLSSRLRARSCSCGGGHKWSKMPKIDATWKWKVSGRRERTRAVGKGFMAGKLWTLSKSCPRVLCTITTQIPHDQRAHSENVPSTGHVSYF